MDPKEALEMAASAWCKPGTSNKVMDPELCKVFADLLVSATHQQTLKILDVLKAADPALEETVKSTIMAEVLIPFRLICPK